MWLRSADSRAVQDVERKAALMHFSSEQAAEMSEHVLWVAASDRQANPRVAHVQSLAKPPSCKSSWVYVVQQMQFVGSNIYSTFDLFLI